MKRTPALELDKLVSEYRSYHHLCDHGHTAVSLTLGSLFVE